MRAGTTRASQPTFALQRLKITNALLSLPSLSLCSLHTCSLPFFSICAASLGTIFRQRTGTQIRNSNNQYFLKERWVSVSSPKLVRYWQDMFTARMRRTISPELNWTELNWVEANILTTASQNSLESLQHSLHPQCKKGWERTSNVAPDEHSDNHMWSGNNNWKHLRVSVDKPLLMVILHRSADAFVHFETPERATCHQKWVFHQSHTNN